MKKFAIVLILTLTTSFVFSQEKDFQLSTHVLDVSKGLPAGDVKIDLEKMNVETDSWELISKKRTEKSGRVNDFLPSGKDNIGVYRLTLSAYGYSTYRGS